MKIIRQRHSITAFLNYSIYIIVLISFLCQNVSLAIPIRNQNIRISQEYGRIDDPLHSSQPEVILIEDAHCVYEAQKNISNILEQLVKNNGIDLVCVEGAAGLVDTATVLSQNPARDLRILVADKFLRSGLLTAAEALSLIKGKNPGFTIWGVEDLKLYLEDYRLFRQVVETAAQGKKLAALLAGVIAEMKRKSYSAELLALDKMVKGYQNGSVQLQEVINFLYGEYGLGREYPSLRAMRKLIHLEEKIDYGQVEKEKEMLIKSPENARAYRQLMLYLRLVKLRDKISMRKMLAELAELIEETYLSLCPDEGAKLIYLYDQSQSALARLLSLQAKRNDLTNQRGLEKLKILAEESGLEWPGNTISLATQFYQLAMAREEALVTNLLAVMKEQRKKQAVLVCGGFHVQGIKDMLAARNVSAVTISPLITEIQKNSRELYLARMLDKRVNPAQMLLELGTGNIQPLLAFSPQGRQRGLAEEIVQALHEIEIDPDPRKFRTGRDRGSVVGKIRAIRDARVKARIVNGQVKEVVVEKVDVVPALARTDRQRAALRQFVQKQVQAALKNLLGRENLLPPLGAEEQEAKEQGEGEQEIRIRLLQRIMDNKLGRIPGFYTDHVQRGVELHTRALLSQPLLEYGLRHELDHAWLVCAPGEEINEEEDEWRVRQNDRKYFYTLSLKEMRRLLDHLKPENDNGIDPGGAVYRELKQLEKDKTNGYQFQNEEPTRIQNKRRRRVANRYLDEDHPLDLVIGNQLIRMIKSGGALTFLVSSLYDMNAATIEFKLTENAVLVIGRNQGGGSAQGKDIVLPATNQLASVRHIRLTVNNIKEARIKIAFEDLKSRNGSVLCQPGRFFSVAQSRAEEAGTKVALKLSEDEEFAVYSKEMENVIRRLNYEVDLSKDGWQAWLRKEFIRARKELAEELRDQPYKANYFAFVSLFGDQFIVEWIRNLRVFQEDILYLRQMRINLVIRRVTGELATEFRALVARRVRMLRQIPGGLIARVLNPGDFFTFEVREEQTGTASGITGINPFAVIALEMVQNPLLRQSTVFSQQSLSAVVHRGMFISPDELKGQGTREHRIASGESVFAHKLFEQLILEEQALPVEDFISILKISGKRLWAHFSENAENIPKALPDVVAILEAALAEGEEQAVQALKDVCRNYYGVHSVFRRPVELLTFCLAGCPAALRELGPQRFYEIRRIARKNMLRSREAVAIRDIPRLGQEAVFEYYTFDGNKHDIYYGDARDRRLFSGIDVLRNDQMELNDRARKAIQMKLNRVLESLRTEKDGTEHCYLYLRLLQEMARLLLRIGAVSTQDVLFMEDCFETLSKRRSITLNEQDRAQVKRVHELVNEALYEVSYQISVSDRRALIAEFFSPTRARTLLDSEGQELGEELGLLDPRKPKTLKAPGSEGADTDYVRKVIADYREQGKVQQVSSPALTEAIRLIPDQQPVLANLVVHCVDAGDQLGLPQFTGAVNPQEMFYALGEKEPGDACLNIYCTKAFWKILQKNALMLAFFLDHEWQEKWLGKTHAAASLRAWLFTDELGMNPFYRFFIDQLGQNRQISYLKSLTRSHVSDPKNVFKSYAMITEAKTVLSVPEAVHSLSEQDAVL